MKCVILAGGSGDSLWPLSRKRYPKQFICNNNSLSLFQETITRNIPFCDEFIIVTNIIYEPIVLGQMQNFQGISYRIFLEEKTLGTAGAISFVISMLDNDEEVMILPSDLKIGQEYYSDDIFNAKELVDSNEIVIMGVTPFFTSTDYGYIKYQDSKVESFVEKPSIESAKELLLHDNVLWNCGMVLSKVDILLDEILKCCPQIINQTKILLDKIAKNENGNIVINVNDEVNAFNFDRCVLEKSDNISVVKMKSSFADLSDFDSYNHIFDDGNKNIITNSCENITVINKTESQLVVVNNLKDIAIVNTADAMYITQKENANDVKSIISDNYSDYDEYFNKSPLVYRTWGTRELIQMSKGYRVRKLVIYPGMKLSKHIHENRNENYSVVSGELTIELENEIIELGSHDSYNIMPGSGHRLCNNTDNVTVVIEVDTGIIIDESDMIDIDDNEYNLPSIYKLNPAFKDYLWGGDSLSKVFGKDSPYDITAESWEVSAHPDGSSIIEGGEFDKMRFEDFINLYGDKVCGWKSKIFDRFPILIKFIDARKALSVQIHPDDDYAFKNENEFGKNEMWYVIDCDKDAYLYCGLSKDTSKEEIRGRIDNQSLTDILNRIKVKQGDVIYVPAGTIHAIGEGILICEIQQNSNCTYRMYDYGRRDKNGNLRELHIDKAMDVLNTEKYMPDIKGAGELTANENSIQQVLSQCKYFQVVKYIINEHEVIQVNDSSFKAIVVIKGDCRIKCGTEELLAKKGESFFVSAGKKNVHVYGECELIVTNI